MGVRKQHNKHSKEGITEIIIKTKDAPYKIIT